MTSIIEFYRSEAPVEYKDALSIMDKYVAKVISGKKPGALWFLEHPSMYTKGTGSNDNDLLKPNRFPVYETGRGGKFTYHGPGQRVAYIMLNIKELHNGKPDLKKFVRQIEEWVIKTLAHLGIDSFPAHERIGIWVKENNSEAKIAALGIRVKKWVSFHGVAINVTPDMEHYEGIVPCGIKDYGVTSINLLGKNTTINELDDLLKMEFCTIFGCELKDVEQL